MTTEAQEQPQHLNSAEYADLHQKFMTIHSEVAELRTVAIATTWTKGKIVAVTGGAVIVVAAVSILSNKAWNALFPTVQESRPARAPRSIPAPPMP